MQSAKFALWSLLRGMLIGKEYESFTAVNGMARVGSGGMMTPGMNGNMPGKGGKR